MASIGQIIEVQVNTGRWCAAVVTKLNVDSINAVALTDGVNPWPNVETPNGLLAASYTNIVEGTGLLNYRTIAGGVSPEVASAIEDAIADALTSAASAAADAIGAAVGPVAADVATLQGTVAALSTALDALPTLIEVQSEISEAIAGIPGPPDLSGYALLPSVASSPTRVIGTTYTPSATRPTQVSASGRFTISSLLLGATSARIDLMCDNNSTPTTIVASARASHSGVVSTLETPWFLSTIVPAGYKYRLVVTTVGSASAALDFCTEQTS